jgi:predicted RNA-binding Zn-ribbon protein involved in translation (DUF1610 family)
MRTSTIKTPAKLIIEQFAKVQRKKTIRFPCPRCGFDTMNGELIMNTLSRRANVYICGHCGIDESIADFYGNDDKLDSWSIVKSMRKE